MFRHYSKKVWSAIMFQIRDFYMNLNIAVLNIKKKHTHIYTSYNWSVAKLTQGYSSLNINEIKMLRTIYNGNYSIIFMLYAT
jgi:hypothetical protein